MNSPDSNHPQISSKPPHLNLHHAFSTLQTHYANLLHHISTSIPQPHLQNPLNPNPNNSPKTLLECSLSSLGNEVKHAMDARIRGFGSRFSGENSAWARIADSVEKGFNAGEKGFKPVRNSGSSLSVEAIEERLSGVPVYALSNSSEEFVLISGVRSKKSLGLFCFKKEDADALLEQMKSMDSTMREGSQVVPVALNKVFQLKVDGVAFRLIPEVAQIKNALKENEKNGLSDKGFLGVPVFQSQSLVLRSQKKTYHPAFFRKEDLEDSLQRASRQQGRLNPAFKRGDIQVAVLEEIMEEMKDNSTSNWDDVVFIPPGVDVSTGPSQK